MLVGTKKNEAVEAIKFALKEDNRWDALEFLRAWSEGDGDALQEWPEWLAHVETLEVDPAALGKALNFDSEAVRSNMDRSGDEERAERAARAKGWTRDGDHGGIIYNTNDYESWKAAVSWSPEHGSVYDSWVECCEGEEIDFQPIDPKDGEEARAKGKKNA